MRFFWVEMDIDCHKISNFMLPIVFVGFMAQDRGSNIQNSQVFAWERFFVYL